MDELELAIWAALEPHVEDHISLDLNNPQDNAAFSGMVIEIAEGVRHVGA